MDIRAIPIYEPYRVHLILILLSLSVLQLIALIRVYNRHTLSSMHALVSTSQWRIQLGARGSMESPFHISKF